ncbi:AraC family transcriptional regulator [Chloroflexales bacterium ZM16-3]|nr:AraC family transcriptional regulator [Chloroflexales bacterium ZM16-3]
MGVGSRESGVGSRESGVGSRESVLRHQLLPLTPPTPDAP